MGRKTTLGKIYCEYWWEHLVGQVQNLWCYWSLRQTSNAQVELFMEICLSKEGHNCKCECGNKGFICFEDKSTCGQWKALCAKGYGLFLAIDKWWGCCGEGEKNLSNFSPFSTYFPRVDTWLNMSRCNLLHSSRCLPTIESSKWLCWMGNCWFFTHVALAIIKEEVIVMNFFHFYRWNDNGQ